MRVSAYVPNLMDRSKVAAAAAAAGQTVVFAAAPAGLDPEADVVIIDLSHPAALDALRATAAASVGFASHVDRDLMDAARAAGCNQVLARSAFFRRLPELLAGL